MHLVIRRAGNGFLLLGTALLSVILGGCGVYQSQISGNFSRSALAASAGGGIPIQVDGNVGGIRGAPLATAVAAAMPPSLDGAPSRYAPCEPYSECPGDHVVWTFGPPSARPASVHPPALSINLHQFGPYRPSPNDVTAKAALFQGGTVVASVSGQVDASGPDDPAFQSLIGRMSRTILSPSWFD